MAHERVRHFAMHFSLSFDDTVSAVESQLTPSIIVNDPALAHVTWPFDNDDIDVLCKD